MPLRRTEKRRRKYVTPWNKALLEKLIVPQVVEEILILLTPRVSYHVHGGPPLDPVLCQLIHSTTVHTISIRSSSILSSHQHLGLPSSLFPSRCPTKIKERSCEIYGYGDNSGAFAHFSLFAAETVRIKKLYALIWAKKNACSIFLTTESL
jgi:hypothetical protein